MRNSSPIQILLLCAAFAGFSPAISSAADSAPQQSEIAIEPITIPGIHNSFRASPRIFSGSQPESDEAFAALAKLGVKTIVSVDGSKPDVAAAHRHGIHYIHLPYGYDGVPTNRITELAKVAASDAGPFFVHCHHGKHRGPTAVAIMCLATAGWTTNRAVAWLHAAGTSTDYPGLYRSTCGFRQPTATELAAVPALPEIAPTSTLVDAMVAIDDHFGHLKELQQLNWQPPPAQPDLSASHEATLLWEQFRELARLPAMNQRSPDFRSKLTQAEQQLDDLRRLLKKPNPPDLREAMEQMGQSCSACHQKYRNE